MSRVENRTTLDVVAERLRQIVLAAPEGDLIGSEDSLIARLGCSRSTIRQVARLLEREGLLKVRRGISGGYFGTRPDIGVIERTVSAHLEALNIDGRDATVLASALWVEVVRKAALADRGQVHAMTEAMKRRVQAMPESASYVMVRDLELLSQAEMFRVTNSTYIKLIFDINVEFSRRRFPDSPIEDDESPEHRAFVKLWREAKIQELNAVALGDADLAAIAAQYSRKVWYRRIGRRFGMSLFG